MANVIKSPLITFSQNIVLNLREIVYVSPSYRVNRETIEEYVKNLDAFIVGTQNVYIENYEIFLSNGKSFTIENNEDCDDDFKLHMSYNDFVDAWYRSVC